MIYIRRFGKWSTHFKEFRPTRQLRWAHDPVSCLTGRRVARMWYRLNASLGLAYCHRMLLLASDASSSAPLFLGFAITLSRCMEAATNGPNSRRTDRPVPVLLR